MTMKAVQTFTATIYVGLKVHDSGVLIDRSVALAVIESFVDKIGLCVTVADTQYIYTNGGEPGLIVGLINYPRFPSMPEAIREKALELAGKLLVACEQFKVSVVMPNETVMIEADEEIA